jgi:hypothetical protein
MERRAFLLAAAACVVAAPQLGDIANAAVLPARQRKPAYYTGDYTPSLEMYSFNLNLNAAIKNRQGTPPTRPARSTPWRA